MDFFNLYFISLSIKHELANVTQAKNLGLQLVAILVDHLDGELELKRDNGTEFTIRFTLTEKDNQPSAHSN